MHGLDGFSVLTIQPVLGGNPYVAALILHDVVDRGRRERSVNADRFEVTGLEHCWSG